MCTFSSSFPLIRANFRNDLFFFFVCFDLHLESRQSVLVQTPSPPFPPKLVRLQLRPKLCLNFLFRHREARWPDIRLIKKKHKLGQRDKKSISTARNRWLCRQLANDTVAPGSGCRLLTRWNQGPVFGETNNKRHSIFHAVALPRLLFHLTKNLSV